jgi:hypothetical protein
MTLSQAPASLQAAVRRSLFAPLSPVQQAGLTASDAVAGDGFSLSVALSGTTALIGAPFKNSNTGAVYAFVHSGSTWTQQAELVASDGVAGDWFGWSVALSGTTALIGARGKNSSAGAGYVFVRSGTAWTQQAELVASDAAAGDGFGLSVALSGTTALIGALAKNSNTGAAYVFVRSGTAWTQQAKVTASDAAAGDQFGTSVALSGTTALIGAPAKNSNTGAAYVFARSGTTWAQQAKLTASDAAAGDLFGTSVALSGTTALISARGKNSSTGAAYVFVRSGTTWAQQAKLTASDGVAGDLFGGAVALSGTMALIGAPFQNSNTGAVYAFVRSGLTWTQQSRLAASDAAAGDWFGYSVVLSGTTALIGAPFKNAAAGAAYVDKLPHPQIELTASDAAAGDQFGTSVALSGTTALIGAVVKNSGVGAAYVFVRSGTGWAQQAELTASDAAIGDYFGYSVALSGTTALIGAATKHNTGAVYVFVRSGTAWAQQAELSASDAAIDDLFGASVAVSGTTALISAPRKNSFTGVAYVFARSGTAWAQQAELSASDGAAFDEFGSSVALSGMTALIGAPKKTTNTGGVYVFARSGTAWAQQGELTASDAAIGDTFGASMALSGTTVLIGAPGKNSSTGAAYLFVRSGTTWAQQAKLTASDGAAYNQFGTSVGLSGTTALIGAIGKNSDAGAAYVFVGSGPGWTQQAELAAFDAAASDAFGYSVALSGTTGLIATRDKNSFTGAAYALKL